MSDSMFGRIPPRKSGMLGKKPKRLDPRTIQLAKYVPAGAPPVPPSVEYWQKRLGYWTMAMNDTVGDCTIAAAAHMVMLWSAFSGKEFIPNDAQVIANYSAITGYKPSDPNTDQGAVELDVLNYWRNKGMMGRPIEGYAAINIKNQEQIRQAIYLFGGAYIGFNVPQSAMDQFNAGQPWDVVANDGGIVGGHAVPVLGYDSQYLYCVTWGSVEKMTPAFWDTYVDEGYVLLSPMWFDARGKTPAGFGVAELRADLGLFGKHP
jgi:hypothetical protein